MVEKKRSIQPNMCFSNSSSIHQESPTRSKNNPSLTAYKGDEFYSPILPGLPDDVAKYCLALVPRSNFPSMGSVCKRWRSFIRSKEFITLRKQAGMLEEWLFVLTMDPNSKESHWEVLDCFGHTHHILPLMPGPMKAGFGVVVLNGKLLVMAGYSVIEGSGSASSDVYQYDSCLNRCVSSLPLNVLPKEQNLCCVYLSFKTNYNQMYTYFFAIAYCAST